MKRWTLRVGAAGAACVVAGTAFAPSAAAHVHVSSPDAVGGGYGRLVFQVPNEEPKADTVALTVRLPKDMPLASVSTMQKPGWTVTSTEMKLAEPVKTDDGLKLTKAVGTVTWEAKPGQGIPPGSFDEFQLSVGPLPRSGGTLVVPAVQRYSDGTTVNWDQPEKNGKEPENPAPSLTFAKASAATHGDPTPAVASAGAAGGGSDLLARVLGVVGLVAGVAGLAVAVLTGRRREPA